MVDLIIVAAGKGTRFGEEYKQFYEINGKPVILYSIQAFMKFDFNKIILVVPPEKVDYAGNLIKNYKRNITVLKGGNRRHQSVRNGLKECDSEFVLIHDGVRPFLKKHLIHNVIEKVKDVDACAPGIPITDTIKLYNDENILWTLNRKNLLSIQTPQSFKNKVLKRALQVENKDNLTDELNLIESINGTVEWIKGDPFNIKITYPEDIKLAELIASKWQEL